jgi:hypothetical protein
MVMSTQGNLKPENQLVLVNINGKTEPLMLVDSLLEWNMEEVNGVKIIDLTVTNMMENSLMIWSMAMVRLLGKVEINIKALTKWIHVKAMEKWSGMMDLPTLESG